MKTSLLTRLFLGIAFFPVSAFAYVSGSASAGPGEWDAQIRASFERGLLGAQNIPESQVREQAAITEYSYRLGTNIGDVWGLNDASLHVFGSYLIHGAEFVSGTQTYQQDAGHLLGIEISANFLHERSRQAGMFIRLSAPIGVMTEKFGSMHKCSSRYDFISCSWRFSTPAFSIFLISKILFGKSLSSFALGICTGILF